MPLTPTFCAKEADVSATASNTLPLIRLAMKSDLSVAGFSRLLMGLLPAPSMVLRAQLGQSFLMPARAVSTRG